MLQRRTERRVVRRRDGAWREPMQRRQANRHRCPSAHLSARARSKACCSAARSGASLERRRHVAPEATANKAAIERRGELSLQATARRKGGRKTATDAPSARERERASSQAAAAPHGAARHQKRRRREAADAKGGDQAAIDAPSVCRARGLAAKHAPPQRHRRPMSKRPAT